MCNTACVHRIVKEGTTMLLIHSFGPMWQVEKLKTLFALVVAE